MRAWIWVLLATGAMSVAVGAVALVVRRSRQALIELVRLVPPCLTLLRDVFRDRAVPRRAKVAPGVALAYLAIPIDLIPDFLPGIGQLDDALIVAWALRQLIKRAGRERVAHHWRGDRDTLNKILDLARVP